MCLQVEATTTGQFILNLKNNNTKYCGHVSYRPKSNWGRAMSEKAFFCVKLPGECSTEALFFWTRLHLENIVRYLVAQLFGLVMLAHCIKKQLQQIKKRREELFCNHCIPEKQIHFSGVPYGNNSRRNKTSHKCCQIQKYPVLQRCASFRPRLVSD